MNAHHGTTRIRDALAVVASWINMIRRPSRGPAGCIYRGYRSRSGSDSGV